MIMATTTLDAHAAVAGAADTAEGCFARAYKRFMAAQEARASRIVSRELSLMSERQLTDLGFDDTDIARIRARADNVAPYWI
jgi:hypothetical protein